MLLDILRWALLAFLAYQVIRGLRVLLSHVRVRRQIARLAGGIPWGTARRLWTLHLRLAGPFGRGKVISLSMPHRVTAYLAAAVIAGALAWLYQSLILGVLALMASIKSLIEATWLVTPPTVLYLSASNYNAHQTHWRIAASIRRLAPYKALSMLESGPLAAIGVPPTVQALSLRVADNGDTDWYAELWWLVTVVPLIVVNIGWSSEQVLQEIEMLFSRNLTSKTLFIVQAADAASDLEMSCRRRLAGQQFRFLSEEQLIAGLCEMLIATRRSGVVPELQGAPPPEEVQ